MPSHMVHAYVDRLYFGRVYWKVHRQMDSAYQYFRGKHRIFWHDPISACAIAADSYPGDENAISAGLLHIRIDYTCSSDPFFHKQLWLLAKEDTQKRRHAKKQETKRKKKGVTRKPDEIEKTEKFFKQLIELKRLAELLRA